MKRVCVPCAARRHFGVVDVLAVASIVIVIAVPSQAQEIFIAKLQKRDNGARLYCGQQLVQALHLVCQGMYYGPFPINKKNLGMPQEEITGRQSQDNTYDLEAWITRPARFPFRERLNGRDFLRRTTRGILDECCMKPCTTDQLRAYCAFDPI